MVAQPPPVDKQLANRLRAWRTEQWIKQETVAAAIGVTGAMLEAWERGLIPIPQDKLVKLMEALGKVYGVD